MDDGRPVLRRLRPATALNHEPHDNGESTEPAKTRRHVTFSETFSSAA